MKLKSVGNRHRLFGGLTFVTAAAVAFSSLTVASLTGASASDQAADSCVAVDTVGTLEWAFRDSFNEYAKNKWNFTSLDGATRDADTGVVTYQQDKANSTFDPTTGEGVIAFTGGTRIKGRISAPDIVMQNPQITVNGDGTGKLSLEVSKKTSSGFDVQRLDYVMLLVLTPVDTDEFVEFSDVQGVFYGDIGPNAFSRYEYEASAPLTFKAGKTVNCPTVSTGAVDANGAGANDAAAPGAASVPGSSVDPSAGGVSAPVGVAPGTSPATAPAAGAADPGAGVSVGDPSVDDSADGVDDVPGGSVDSSDATHTPGTAAPTPGATPAPGTDASDVDTSDVDAPNAGVVTPGTGSVDTTTPGGVESDEPTDVDVDTAPTAVVAEGLESAAGEEFTLTGRNFAPNSEVVVEFHSTPVRLGVVMTDADGVFSFTGRVPSGAAVGDHNIVLRQGDREVRIPYVVKQSVPVKVEATDHDHDHAGDAAGHGYGYGQADAGEHAGHDHGLAVTGAGAGQFAAVGVALLVLAAGLLVVSRRRV